MLFFNLMVNYRNVFSAFRCANCKQIFFCDYENGFVTEIFFGVNIFSVNKSIKPTMYLFCFYRQTYSII